LEKKGPFLKVERAVNLKRKFTYYDITNDQVVCGKCSRFVKVEVHYLGPYGHPSQKHKQNKIVYFFTCLVKC
jgi:hypothetical protein